MRDLSRSLRAKAKKPRLTRDELQRETKDLQAFVDKLYGGKNPTNVLDDRWRETALGPATRSAGLSLVGRAASRSPSSEVHRS